MVLDLVVSRQVVPIDGLLTDDEPVSEGARANVLRRCRGGKVLLQQRIHPPSRARVVRVHRKRNRKRVLLECNVLCRTVATTPSVVTVLVSPIGGRPVEHSIGLMDDHATNLLALDRKSTRLNSSHVK